MGEKIKDFIFDISDTLIALVMIVLIVGVVSWKISDSMTYSNALAKAAPPEIELPADASGTDPVESTDVTDPAETLPETPSSSDPPSETPEITTPVVTPPPAVAPPVSNGQKVTVNIKSGSTGYDIAKVLVDKGLVKDTQTFIQRVEALKLGSKLKADTFELTIGMPLDDMIKLLTGQK